LIAISGIDSGQVPISSSSPVRDPLHWRHRVRTKLIALVALMVLPISAVGLFQAYTEYNRHVDMELQVNLELADSVAHAFRNFTEGVWNTSEILATTLYRHGNPLSPERAREMLMAQALVIPAVDDFVWFDETGKVIAASDSNLDAISMPYVERLAAGEGRLVTNVISGNDSVRPLLVVASAIQHGGAFRGGIAALIDAETLDLVLPVERRRGRMISLANPSNFLVYVIPPDSVPRNTRQLVLEASLPTLLQGTANTFLDYVTPWDGIKRMGAIVSIPEVGWSVIATAPMREVVGPLIASQAKSVLVLVATAILSIVVASLIARDLSHRLHRLWEAASSWSQANFQVRAEVTGDDELARTAITFNDMAARLQRLEEEREQFLHAAAHEMANPVSSILSIVQLLRHQIRQGNPAPVQPENLDRKLAAIARDANILAGLIPDTARLYSQEQSWSIRPQPTELVEFLIDLVDAVRSRSEHVVTLDIGSIEQLWINVDAQRFKQVMRNLVNNALKYSPTGEEIDIGMRIEGDKVTIWVRDHGVGIPPGEEELIFQTFRRAANVQAIPGSGLGLFVSKQIVDAHGGRIWAENNPDGGATFYVQLPL